MTIKGNKVKRKSKNSCNAGSPGRQAGRQAGSGAYVPTGQHKSNLAQGKTAISIDTAYILERFQNPHPEYSGPSEVQSRDRKSVHPSRGTIPIPNRTYRDASNALRAILAYGCIPAGYLSDWYTAHAPLVNSHWIGFNYC